MGQPSDLTQLTARIRTAFRAREYPGDELIVVDISGADWQQIELLGEFRGLHWEEVPLNTIIQKYMVLSFFTPEAFRYYLPAFLLAALEQGRSSGDAKSALIYALTPPSISFRTLTLDISEDMLALLSPEAREMLTSAVEKFRAITEAGGGVEQVEQRQQELFEMKMTGFTPDERAVIRDFLAFVSAGGDADAQKALEGYWGQASG